MNLYKAFVIAALNLIEIWWMFTFSVVSLVSSQLDLNFTQNINNKFQYFNFDFHSLCAKYQILEINILSPSFK